MVDKLALVPGQSVGIPPNMEKVVRALRSIGYKLPQAVADLVDNSVDAGSEQVLIRLVLRANGQFDVSIWDNGVGMSASKLKEAMRIGSDAGKTALELGKFGMGLKLASLSQCPAFDVVSHEAGGEVVGLRASVEGLAASRAAVLRPEYCTERLVEASGPLHSASGTVVVWHGLDRLMQEDVLTAKDVLSVARKLRAHLGLVYHRLIAGESLSIATQTEIEGDGSLFPPDPIGPLDPFGYPHPGRPGFPKRFQVPSGGVHIPVTVHIWPPKSQSPEYRLPGGANSRQGFYVFRNDRLLQAGGWNGIREEEPHLSLCRVSLELPAALDELVHLDIKKASIDLPEGFPSALSTAESRDGTRFDECVSIARVAYREAPAACASQSVALPFGAVGAAQRRALAEVKQVKQNTSDRIQVRWKKLDRGQLIDIDRENRVLSISRALQDATAGLTAADVVPTFVYLLLEEQIVSQRKGRRMEEERQKVEKILSSFIENHDNHGND